ncbi:MAG: aspartate kinase [Sporomusa sp.]
MRIIVQKFGGTSVASSEVRELVLRKVEQAREQGLTPVIVVSAMGRQGAPYATDTLIGIARSVYEDIAARELDQIMYCGEMISAVVMTATLQAAGMDAAMLTGGQAGIITDDGFNRARILRCDTANIMRLLNKGKIPVICGFQGVTKDGEFTTLGRGGSDTTAAALGAALKAEMVEIYSDVDGIMTADPKIVNDARILDCVSYAEVCQLAHEGAKIIHPRAVEVAMQKNIPIVVKSTFSDAPGTLITNIAKENISGTAVADRIATGVTYLTDIVQIKVHLDESMASDASFKVFRIMADSDISVDLINVLPGQIMFTIEAEHIVRALAILKHQGYEIELLENCAKVSVVGGGMREVPGVMASFIEALSVNKIAIFQTVDSHTSISALVSQSNVGAAVKSLHEKFSLSN